MKKILTVMTLACLVSSCSLFSPVKGPEATYVLNSIAHPAVHGHSDVILLVSQVESDPLYNTPQIAYTNKPYQIAYYAKNTWAEPPATMLHPLIIQTLQNTHYFRAITSNAVGQYDYVLNTQLLELRQDFLYNNIVRLKFKAQLISAGSNQIIASKTFEITQRAYQKNPYGGVVAANQATSRLLYQLSQFCLHSLGSDYVK